MNLLGTTLARLIRIGNAMGATAGACRKGRIRRIVLRREATLAVRPSRRAPQEVSCRRGLLWITQEGSPEDIILREGQRVALRNRGKILIQALTKASFSMTGPQQCGQPSLVFRPDSWNPLKVQRP